MQHNRLHQLSVWLKQHHNPCVVATTEKKCFKLTEFQADLPLDLNQRSDVITLKLKQTEFLVAPSHLPKIQQARTTSPRKAKRSQELLQALHQLQLVSLRYGSKSG